MPSPPTDCLFLKACRSEPVPRPPVWMMRQAGRYLPEYRAVRARADFLTLCRTPDLAMEVTLQPVDLLGVDAAVIFSDILVVLEAIGQTVLFEEKTGPRITNPVQHEEDLTSLKTSGIPESLPYVYQSIRQVSAALSPRGIPVIGFAGAPFTLAAYAIEGKTSRDFHRTRQFMHARPGIFSRLLDLLADAVTEHLLAQIAAGAAAVQIFESWGGILGSEEYARRILPGLQKIVSRLRDHAPVILYVNGSPQHLGSMKASGATVLSVDWRLPLNEVRRIIGPGVALQGNLDPTALYAPPAQIAHITRAMLSAHPAPGHIANLGHGILPDIPVEHARAFIDTVRNPRPV
ncbi:MAG: uroporphyrinogen decarboxylase [Verrucomicrobiae bacterium]|nr:uroporphyrinogen decarboxylase [Verrucomicrobiae bacterium]